MIRVPSETVSPYNHVWFREDIPRCSFISWLDVLGILPMRDNLSLGGMNVPSSCVLCSSDLKTHDHMFLQYSYVVVGSSHFFLAILSVSPESILSFYVILEHNHFVSSTKSSIVLKLLLQVNTYGVRETHTFSGNHHLPKLRPSLGLIA